MDLMQPCARSLRAAIPNGSPRIAPLLRSRPLSTSRPSLYSADNILLPRIPVDVYDPAADIPKDPYIGVTSPYDLLPPGTKILKDSGGNQLHPDRALCDAIQRLQTTPWRIKTEPHSYLERGYVFPTPALAFDFVGRMWVKARTAWNHHPTWAGCGRRVYMCWQSKQNNEIGLTARDMVHALACDARAAKLVGGGAAAGASVIGSDRGWEEPNRLFGAKELQVHPFYPRQRQLSKNMTNFSIITKWVKDTAFVPKVAADEEHYPVWSVIHGAACVSQTYWRVVDGPDETTLLLPPKNLFGWEPDKRVLMKDSTQSRLLINLLHRVAPRNK
ncbi:uncharacterized protein LTHEOB_239 [Lasiodiplodia theobromae]|uniref:uncharacterized protein n=1 Tax=Lasiodiplodia theobromae TaxID=45133 RepID=UPI0015C35437|nr:uncharacterized protein LTHEOB_239 [Lasiodiplodia theobromae]KAF4543540.1 hypothetical protein LTHEOB_239 [Lasiodiplodia theobromae]